MLTSAQAIFAQVYVSPLGNDTSGTGTKASPFLTLGRALETGNTNIQVESGDYIFNAPTVIPPNVAITGNYCRFLDEDGVWQYVRSTAPTNFLVNVQTPAFQVFPHPPAFKISSGAVLQFVTIKGGYYSAQVEPAGAAFEVEFSGGITSALYVINNDVLGTPAYIDRCRVTGGGYGIIVERNGRALIRSTSVENALVRGIYVSGTGIVDLQNCVIQRANSHGLFVQGNPNVTVQNCVLRRNTGAGVYIYNAPVAIQGCLIEGNSDGFFLDTATGTQISNSTISNNRLNGVTVNKGLPSLSYNIIANNAQYGVAERVQEDQDGQPAPIQTGALVSNLFWNNTLAAYYDEGTTALNTVGEIATATNSVSPTGTIIADPQFTNSAKSDYRLAKTSPALDVTGAVTGFDADLDGNPRAVDIDSVGNAAPDTVDLGAYETQTYLRTKFATEFADRSSKADPNHPGQNADVLTSPRWIFDASSPFEQLVGKILPGRLRLFSKANMSYGGMGRTLTDDLTQSASQVAVVHATMEADDASAFALARVRMNDIDKLDVTSSFFVLGRRAMTPNFTGRTYEFAYDIRQGQYADIPIATKPVFHQSLSYDILDVFLFPYRSEHDLTAFDVEFVDRATFNAQFTNLAKAWTFDPGETFDWEPGIAPPGFNQPFLSYDPGRGALRFEGFQDQSFAGWGSPLFQLPAGKRFKVECRVANGLTPELGPNFRIRVVSKLVDVSYDTTCLAFPGGSATPSAAGSLYTVYGVAPDAPSLLVNGNNVEMYMAVELFGFAYVPGRDPRAVMYLDDVKVYTAP